MNAALRDAVARLEYVARDEQVPAGLAVGAKLAEDVAAVLAALSIQPAEDIRALVDHLNGLMDSLDESVSHEQIYDQLLLAWNMARDLRPQPSSPPADDVREAQEVAMEREVTRILSRLSKRDDWAEDDTAIGGMAAHIVAVALEAAASVRPYGTVTPTPEEWAAQMDAERVRQIEHGYDDAHDAEHGAAHLLNWAIEYARRGDNLAAATMARCALRLPHGTVPPPPDDVREALDAVLRENDGYWPQTRDAILSRFEVRPRGAITDTEVEVPPLADDCDCEDREALVRPEGLVCGTCGKVIEAAREARS